MNNKTGILSKSAQKGLSKFCKLPSYEMRVIGRKYTNKTGLNPNNVENKQEFYEFVNKECEINGNA